MLEEKQQRGDAIALVPSMAAPVVLRGRFVLAFAISAVLAAAMSHLSTNSALDEQWAQIEKQNPVSIAPKQPVKAPSGSAPEANVDLLAPEPATWSDEVVTKGDTLSLIFARAGYSDREVYDVVNQSNEGKSLERIFPGQTIAFLKDSSDKLAAVRHLKSPLETITYTRTDTGFESQIDIRSPEPREAWRTGVITSSLFLAGEEVGLSQSMILDMANIFSGVIDFALDPRRGDTMQLVYEELYLDDEKIEDGGIIAASFTNQGETFNAYRYTDSKGETNYYNEDGVSMRKSFLMAPLDFTRISSNFNMRRLHPIYKTTRPHRGTDYAAPTGTPVYAAGDGRVIKAGYTNANGNYVFIQHSDQYITHYLHLQKRMVGVGTRVSQSQVIGTVGATGAATGPHLHYEFLVNGVHRNPRTILKDLPKAQKLPEEEMDNFRQAINRASFQLALLRSVNRVAMNDPVETNTAPN